MSVFINCYLERKKFLSPVAWQAIIAYHEEEEFRSQINRPSDLVAPLLLFLLTSGEEEEEVCGGHSRR